jgi:hypothetical protein
MTTAFGRFLRQNAIALLALFIALGGTALAAASALPRNSVGTKQLKKNAVTGLKIKNRSPSSASKGPWLSGQRTRSSSLPPGYRPQKGFCMATMRNFDAASVCVLPTGEVFQSLGDTIGILFLDGLTFNTGGTQAR